MKYIKLFEGFKEGSPEELVELLKELPIHETADSIRNQVLEDLTKYYEEDIELPNEKKGGKKYTYTPENELIKPYTVEVEFFSSNNDMNLGYCDASYIQLKYLKKGCMNYRSYNIPNPSSRISRSLYMIIKHECSHAYLDQKGIEKCLYHTDPKGLEVYYKDRQEIVLHSREIFEDFIEHNRNWKTYDLSKIEQKIKDMVKSLKYRTNIHAPFGAGLQKKYVSFIMNSYVKPGINEDIGHRPYPVANMGIFARYFICDNCFPFMAPYFVKYCPNCQKLTREVNEDEFLKKFKEMVPPEHLERALKEHEFAKRILIPLSDLDHDGDETEYDDKPTIHSNKEEDDNYGYSEI
jgi:hypothetical protein